MSQFPPESSEQSPTSEFPVGSASEAPKLRSAGVPLWVTLVSSLLCLALGLAVSLLVASRKSEAPAQSAAPQASSVEVKKPPPTQLELAAQGDPGAVDALEKTEPANRSIEQALALSQGRAAEKKLALNHLRSTIEKQGGTPDAETTKRMVQLAKDVDTARDVIGMFATLPGPLGPDLLYEFSNDKKTPPELAKLAEQLLLNKHVRPKASPALALLLDLRETTTCEARRDLLVKAPEVGDRRMLGLAVSYLKKAGCGDTKRDDCHPCLREDNSKVLRTALTKTQRKAPSYY